jgi:hypothetical protein
MKIDATNVLVTADRRVQLTWPYPGRVVIPAGAVWDEAQSEWALGDRDADGRKHGLTAYYRADGSLANHCEYAHGVPHGWFKRYHESGEASREGTFVDGEIHGADSSYRSDTPTTELAFPVDQTGADVWRCELSWWHGRVTGVRWYDRAGGRVTRWGAPHEPYSPVPELNLLWELQDWAGFEAYAQGFGLARFGDQSGLRAGWTEDDDALARLIPFAQATGTGSEYAFWRVDDRTDIGSLPVVVFGDEGGELVMARNVGDLSPPAGLRRRAVRVARRGLLLPRRGMEAPLGPREHLVSRTRAVGRSRHTASHRPRPGCADDHRAHRSRHPGRESVRPDDEPGLDFHRGAGAVPAVHAGGAPPVIEADSGDVDALSHVDAGPGGGVGHDGVEDVAAGRDEQVHARLVLDRERRGLAGRGERDLPDRRCPTGEDIAQEAPAVELDDPGSRELMGGRRVRREDRLVDQDHVVSQPAQQQRGGRARSPGTDHDDVAAVHVGVLHSRAPR